jgi:hypothetical protein
MEVIMSRILASALLLAAALVGTSALAAASVPDPPHSSVSWAGPFNGVCTFPVICPKGDIVATVNVTVKDQFGAPMGSIAANEIDAEGTCLLGGGSPCAQVINVIANAATNSSGFTTITISKAGGCCTDLRIVARGVILNTLSYESYDYTADLRADLSDLGFLADTFNKVSGNAGYNGCFDFNCDNAVNLSDLGFFADHFNHICT